MSKYFGTDGFRGEAGITLTADHAYKVGRFLGWYYNALREHNGDTDSARIRYRQGYSSEFVHVRVQPPLIAMENILWMATAIGRAVISVLM